MRRVALSAFVVLLAGETAVAQECVPPPGGICLTAEQRQKVRVALEELDDIHKSKAQLEFLDPVTIVRDWDGRVYVSGGEEKPLRLRLRIGKHVDRDLEAKVRTHVWYRDKPPDPMFRLRIRAQLGPMIPSLFDSFDEDGDEGKISDGFDAGVGWDFFHLGILNLSAYTGVRSAGALVGIDLTKNFGTSLGPVWTYRGFDPNLLLSAYFSFN